MSHGERGDGGGGRRAVGAGGRNGRAGEHAGGEGPPAGTEGGTPHGLTARKGRGANGVGLESERKERG